jgi:CotH kinase protein
MLPFVRLSVAAVVVAGFGLGGCRDTDGTNGAPPSTPADAGRNDGGSAGSGGQSPGAGGQAGGEGFGGMSGLGGSSGSGGPKPDAGMTADGGSAPGSDAAPYVPHASAMSVAVYDESTIIDVQLTFPEGEWMKLLTLMGAPETRWVRCTFSTLGGPVAEANCRRKGNLTDWPFEKKPQIVVRFNLTNKDGRYRGLRRFNFESFDGTDAPIRDRLGMWMMREAGIDAPRVNHARVFKDGQLLGLYQNIESDDREFLEDHFGPDGDGNLWEGGFDLKTNELVNDHARLDALETLVMNEPLTGDHTAFFGTITSRIDVKQILRELAAETALITEDNYSNGSTNFDYYEHPKRGFIVIPWDLDGIYTNGGADADIWDYRGASDEPNKLRLLINQNPAWRTEYENNLVQIRDQIMVRMPARVDMICAQIAPAIAADPNRTSSMDAFMSDCEDVKRQITARIASLKRILGR